MKVSALIATALLCAVVGINAEETATQVSNVELEVAPVELAEDRQLELVEDDEEEFFVEFDENEVDFDEERDLGKSGKRRKRSRWGKGGKRYGYWGKKYKGHCNYVCPKYSKPYKGTWCPDDEDDCYCKRGYEMVGGSCKPISCQPGYYYKYKYKKCVPYCDDDEKWDSSLGECVYKCDDDEEWGKKWGCRPKCGSGYYWRRKGCKSYCDPWEYWQGGKCWDHCEPWQRYKSGKCYWRWGKGNYGKYGGKYGKYGKYGKKYDHDDYKYKKYDHDDYKYKKYKKYDHDDYKYKKYKKYDYKYKKYNKEPKDTNSTL